MGGFTNWIEAFWSCAEQPKGFPLSLLLPITPAIRRNMFRIRMANSLAENIYVFKGPNHNSVGTAEPDTYGHAMSGFGVDRYWLAINGFAAEIGIKTKA
jgi:hypothetical protein